MNILCIFIDLSKAFDTVNHDILLKKLKCYGIGGTTLAWFKSYLSNRKQYIPSNSLPKEYCNILCGVPQGSILGPLLFLIYVNDLCHASSILMEIMFADDTNLFLSHKNIDILFQMMQKELQNISTWFKANKLSLNVNKTKWSLFHPSSKKRFIPDTLPALTVDNNSIKRESVTKFLGV